MTCDAQLLTMQHVYKGDLEIVRIIFFQWGHPAIEAHKCKQQPMLHDGHLFFQHANASHVGILCRASEH